MAIMAFASVVGNAETGAQAAQEPVFTAATGILLADSKTEVSSLTE